MNYFQEVTIIPDPEIPLYAIWSKLYTQLHIALADVYNNQGIDTIGVSFPNYKAVDKQGNRFATLGYKLRLFAPDKATLQALNINHWLERLTDYVHIKNIDAVGDKATGYLVVKRYRYKPIEQQASSLAQKLGISEADAMAIVQKRKPEMHLPYIQLFSESRQVNYRLKILQKSVDSPKAGTFGTYGLNGMTGDTTVPHW